jgi:hypothetical protein
VLFCSAILSLEAAIKGMNSVMLNRIELESITTCVSEALAALAETLVVGRLLGDTLPLKLDEMELDALADGPVLLDGVAETPWLAVILEEPVIVTVEVAPLLAGIALLEALTELARLGAPVNVALLEGVGASGLRDTLAVLALVEVTELAMVPEVEIEMEMELEAVLVILEETDAENDGVYELESVFVKDIVTELELEGLEP